MFDHHLPPQPATPRHPHNLERGHLARLAADWAPFRVGGSVPDERIAEAIGVIESKRGPDGRWRLENPHEDQLDIVTGEVEGEPSRWLTLRAMRVLRWYEGR